MNQAEMDRIYSEMPLEKIPWNIETPPDALVEFKMAHNIVRRTLSGQHIQEASTNISDAAWVCGAGAVEAGVNGYSLFHDFF